MSSVPPLRIGTLTLGQAPRADLAPLLDMYQSRRVEFYHRGALDGFTQAAIAQHFAPRGDTLLTTRCLDGSCVHVSYSAVEDTLQLRLKDLESHRCQVVLMLCSTRFPALSPKRAELIYPDDVIPAWVTQSFEGQRLGILTQKASAPHVNQWNRAQVQPIVGMADPYEGSYTAFLEAAQSLVDQGAQALILDGMGFQHLHRRWCLEVAHCPVYTTAGLLTQYLEVAINAWLSKGHKKPVRWETVR